MPRVDSEGTQTYVLSPALVFLSYVALGKLQKFSLVEIPHLQNETSGT